MLGAIALQAYENLWSSLRSGLGRTEADRFSKVVLITSSGEGEGKTTTAFNLGIAAARAGQRTLLLEVDWRYVSQSYRLGVQPILGPELQSYYEGRSGDPIQSVPEVENLFILPGPGPQTSAAAMLDAVGQFLITARESFDLIVVDAPPLSPGISALVLGIPVDGWVMVTRANYTQRAKLESDLGQWGHRPGFLGGLLNDAGRPKPS
ncbi:hypothetical protein C8B47_14105 [filamentous cyanobacterium CCP4]|nr:hypothetical protein C8B47_14105 [filamentous cyanobacterium CCP4]